MPLLVPEVTIAVFINNHGDRDKDGRSLPEIVWVKGIDLDQMTVDDLGDGLKEVLLASGGGLHEGGSFLMLLAERGRLTCRMPRE